MDPKSVSPFCSRLRSKKYYFLDAPARTPEDLLDASGHCWCAETHQSVGADGKIVAIDDCADAARGCFKPQIMALAQKLQ